MAIAIGALVDDAIIDVENVVRRLRENAASPPAEQRPAAAVVRDATLEIRTSIVFATIIIVLVFLPIFGLVWRRRPTADAARVRVHRGAAGVAGCGDRRHTGTRFAFLPGARSILQRTRRLAGAYRSRHASPRICRARSIIPVWSWRHRPLLLVVGRRRHARGWARPSCRNSTKGSLTVQANTLPGTSLPKSDEIGRRVEQILLAQPEVVATARRTGRAEYDEHVQGVEAAEIDVGLRETGRPRAELLAELRRGFSTLPGTNVTIGQPISHRIDHMLSGTRANIAVKIFGDDLPDAPPSRRARPRRRDAAFRAPSMCRSNSRWTCRSSASC